MGAKSNTPIIAMTAHATIRRKPLFGKWNE
jgi:hypothetical protein